MAKELFSLLLALLWTLCKLRGSWSFSLTPPTTPLRQPPLSATVEAPACNYRSFSPVTSPSEIALWQSLVPLLPGERGCDVTVHWTCPKEGSRQLLQECFHDEDCIVKLQPSLQQSLETFQSLVGQDALFKARIVATRGASGTKCPRWHVDHVPMRWIQAWVGPGCDHVIGPEGISVGLDEDGEKELVVDESRAHIRHAAQGEGMVLWGAENREGLLPAVHKSPSLGPFQGRVLLTVDIAEQ